MEADVQAEVELDVARGSVGETAIERRGVLATAREVRELEEAAQVPGDVTSLPFDEARATLTKPISTCRQPASTVYGLSVMSGQSVLSLRTIDSGVRRREYTPFSHGETSAP